MWYDEERMVSPASRYQHDEQNHGQKDAGELNSRRLNAQDSCHGKVILRILGDQIRLIETTHILTTWNNNRPATPRLLYKCSLVVSCQSHCKRIVWSI